MSDTWAEIDWLALACNTSSILESLFQVFHQCIEAIMEYEDIVASNPTTVKERIDDALQSLSNLASSTRSRGDILADLAK